MAIQKGKEVTQNGIIGTMPGIIWRFWSGGIIFVGQIIGAASLYRLYIPILMYNLEVYPAENIWREWKTGVIFALKRRPSSDRFQQLPNQSKKLIHCWTFWTILLLGKSWWRFRRPIGGFIPSACEVVSPCDSLPCPERALPNLKASQKSGAEKLPRGPQMRLFRCVRRYPTAPMSWRHRKKNHLKESADLELWKIFRNFK